MATRKLGRPKKSGGKSGVDMVPQPHGGAIRKGSLPGNTPGTGRPPSEIRAAMRKALDTDVLASLAQRYVQQDVDALGYANFLAKYGLGEKNEMSVVSPDVQSRLQQQVTLIGSRPSWDSQELLDQLSEVWK